MRGAGPKGWAKALIGRAPLAVEAWEALKPARGQISGGYRVDRLQAALPGWIRAAQGARQAGGREGGRRILVVASLRWWLEYSVALGLYLYGLGHEVDLAYLPYRTWFEPVDPFDARRQSAYLRRALGALQGVMGLFDLSRGGDIPKIAGLDQQLHEQTLLDTQYTQQRESLDLTPGGQDHALYQLRMARNKQAVTAAYPLLAAGSYDAVVIPNGSILEFGALFRLARWLGIRTVTYEFGEQRERMWLAQDEEVMRLNTDPLWQARGAEPLSESEWQALRELYAARRGGRLFANFARKWQAGESKGAAQARRELNLDPERPMILLCTNVVGDSLALDRQIFTAGMADWLEKTVRFLAEHPGAQLVVRVHPGELLGAGHPSVEIVRGSLPQMPDHVRLIPPESPINTYDLIELADLGLVYTTTVGMEMAMNGVPVVVSGRTHYRGKGFTYDPETLDEYFSTLVGLLDETGGRLPRAQSELAWRYAHRFFFEYPFPFPWHLISFWEDVQARPLESVLQEEAVAGYRRTLKALAGEPIRWGREGG